MHIGNRSFPYPVLNKIQELSDYVSDSSFYFTFETETDGTPIIQDGKIVFKNLHYVLTDVSLINLLEQEKIKGAFIVECSASIFREKFDISSVPYDLTIPADKINGNVIVSCYLYATEDIENFQSDSFVSEYSGYSFEIEKFDIIAVDDGFKFKIELDSSQDDKVASIFTIVKIEGNKTIMSYSYDEKRIIIRLPSIYFDFYDNIKMKKECNNISFAIIAIPVLACCLRDVCATNNNIEEILEEYSWFKAICNSYQRFKGIPLSTEDFECIDKFELAQLVLNSATCIALKDFDNMLFGTMGQTEEDGDD